MLGSNQRPQREWPKARTRTTTWPAIGRTGGAIATCARSLAARSRPDGRPSGDARADRARSSECLAPPRGVRGGGWKHRVARPRRSQWHLCQRRTIARRSFLGLGGPHRYRPIRIDVRWHGAHQDLACRQCRAAGARRQLRCAGQAGQWGAATYPSRCQPTHPPLRVRRYHRCQRLRQVHADEYHGRSGASD